MHEQRTPGLAVWCRLSHGLISQAISEQGREGAGEGAGEGEGGKKYIVYE